MIAKTIKIQESKKSKIIDFRTMGYNDEEIIKRLKINADTLRVYKEQIDSDTQKWLRSLATDGGYILSYKRVLRETLLDIEIITKQIKKMERRLQKRKADMKAVHAINMMMATKRNLTETYWKLLNKNPMVLAFNKFVEDNITTVKEEKEGDDKTHGHMPLIPEGA